MVRVVSPRLCCACVGVELKVPRALSAYAPTIENAFRKEACWAGEPVDLVIRDTAGQSEGSVFQLQFGAGVHGYVYVSTCATPRSTASALNWLLFSGLCTASPTCDRCVMLSSSMTIC